MDSLFVYSPQLDCPIMTTAGQHSIGTKGNRPGGHCMPLSLVHTVTTGKLPYSNLTRDFSTDKLGSIGAKSQRYYTGAKVDWRNVATVSTSHIPHIYPPIITPA